MSRANNSFPQRLVNNLPNLSFCISATLIQPQRKCWTFRTTKKDTDLGELHTCLAVERSITWLNTWVNSIHNPFHQTLSDTVKVMAVRSYCLDQDVEVSCFIAGNERGLLWAQTVAVLQSAPDFKLFEKTNTKECKTAIMF